MATHEIPNQALCKYKGNVDSPDDILNYKNSKGLLLSRGNANLTSHLWVGFPFILPQSLINATTFKIKIYLYTGNNTNRQDRFSVNQKTNGGKQTKQRIGVYFSNTKYGEYNSFAEVNRTSRFIESKTEPYIITLDKHDVNSDAETFGIVLMDQTTRTGTIVTPKITIEKIEFYIKNQIIEEFDFCDYDLNSSPFNSSPNEQDIATIVYKDEAQVEENKLKLSKGDIYSVNNKHIVWNGIEWKLLGNNPDLSKYQLAEDNALNTEDKTIVGAINEIQANAFGRIDQLGQSKQDKISVQEGNGLQWLDEEGTILGIDTSIIAPRELVDTLVSSALTREIKTNREILDTTAPSYDNYPSNIIYMLPSENEDGTYDEYMNVNNKWEQIGSTKIGLSGYVPVEAWQSHLQNYENLIIRIMALENSQGAINEVLEDVY